MNNKENLAKDKNILINVKNNEEAWLNSTYDNLIKYIQFNKISLDEYQDYFQELKQAIANKSLDKPFKYVEALYNASVIIKYEDEEIIYQNIKLQLEVLLKKSSFIEAFEMISNFYNQKTNNLNYIVYKMAYGLINLSEMFASKDIITEEFIIYLINVIVKCDEEYQRQEVKKYKENLEILLREMRNKKVK